MDGSDSYQRKQVLAVARGGAYAHAGEEEAIDLAFEGLGPDSRRRILDAGCGLGQTADYIRRHGWGCVTGIDIDASCVTWARAQWPEVAFEHADLLGVGEHGPRFDLVTLFNVLYAVTPQSSGLRALRQAVVEGGQLLLFDYTDRGGFAEHPLVVEGRAILPRPLVLSSAVDVLADAGWRVDEMLDLTPRYLEWYEALCTRLRERRDAIHAVAGTGGYAYAVEVYEGHVAAIRAGHLGGVLIRAGAV